MTEQQRLRVVRAIAETQTGLDRAMRYSPEFRDLGLISSYEKHLVNLNKAIATDDIKPLLKWT